MNHALKCAVGELGGKKRTDIVFFLLQTVFEGRRSSNAGLIGRLKPWSVGYVRMATLNFLVDICFIMMMR